MIFELELIEGAQTFTAALDGDLYDFTLLYREARDGGGWFVDIVKNGHEAIRGLPVILYTDLLEQYAYRGFGHLAVDIDGETSPRRPVYADMGSKLHFYWSAFPHELATIF